MQNEHRFRHQDREPPFIERFVLLLVALSFGGCTQPAVQPSSTDGSHLGVGSEDPHARTNRLLREFDIAERNAYAAYKEAIHPYAQRVVEGLDAEMDWNVKHGNDVDTLPNVGQRKLRLEYEGIAKGQFLRTDLVGVYEFVDESNTKGNLILETDGSCRLESPVHPDWKGTWSVEGNEVVLQWEQGSGARLKSLPQLWDGWKFFTWVQQARHQ